MPEENENIRERFIEMYKPLIKKCVDHGASQRNPNTGECNLANGSKNPNYYITCGYRDKSNHCTYNSKQSEKTTLGDKV